MVEPLIFVENLCLTFLPVIQHHQHLQLYYLHHLPLLVLQLQLSSFLSSQLQRQQLLSPQLLFVTWLLLPHPLFVILLRKLAGQRRRHLFEIAYVHVFLYSFVLQDVQLLLVRLDVGHRVRRRLFLLRVS